MCTLVEVRFLAPHMATPKPCIEPGCERKKKKGVHRCSWHWLERQPIDRQVRAAQWRLERAQSKPVGFLYRARVPKAEWPEGGRWCAGCQSFVPLHYARGSRCRACASQAAYASHAQRTYEITPEEYQRLLEWQDGRCYICQRAPGKRRLAVDHDHRCTAGHPPEQGCSLCIRGLLCASDDWGCNKTLALPLNDVEAARRLLAYVELPPVVRMRAGEPPVAARQPSGTLRALQASVDLRS